MEISQMLVTIVCHMRATLSGPIVEYNRKYYSRRYILVTFDLGLIVCI